MGSRWSMSIMVLPEKELLPMTTYLLFIISLFPPIFIS
jgi:hypothetical protein